MGSDIFFHNTNNTMEEDDDRRIPPLVTLLMAEPVTDVTTIHQVTQAQETPAGRICLSRGPGQLSKLHGSQDRLVAQAVWPPHSSSQPQREVAMMAMTTVSGKGNSDDDDDDDERRLATSGREQCWLSNSTIQYEQSL